MGSPTVDQLRSPFENVFQILPQGHDKALKQAFFNAAATVFVALVVCAAIAVYYILEVFLKPLMWAILCGTLLHPFKSTLTAAVKGWLSSLRKSGTPLIVGTVLVPLKLVDSTAESLGVLLFSHLKQIIGAVLIVPTVYTIYYFGPLQQIFNVFRNVVLFVYSALGYFNAIWVWTLVVAYVLIVIIYWTPESRAILKPLGIPVWGALLFHIASAAGPLSVPLLILGLVSMIVGLITELKATSQDVKPEEASNTQSENLIHRLMVRLMFWRKHDSASPDSSLNESVESVGDETKSQSAEETAKCDVKSQTEVTSTEREGLIQSQTTADTSVTDKSQNEEADTGQQGSDNMAETDGQRPNVLDLPPTPTSGRKKKIKRRTMSDHCFIGLGWGLAFTCLWRNLWLINLLPIFIAVLLIKKAGKQLGIWSWTKDKCNSLVDKCSCAMREEDSRSDVLFPKPIRGLIKLTLKGDKKIVHGLEDSLDKAVSIMLIILVFVGAVFFTFFMAIQVHRESMHLVSVSSNVLNKSLHPQVGHPMYNITTSWMPDNETMQKALDTMVGNAYIYGREWIANKIHNVVDGDEEGKSHIEKQVLQVWDKVYEGWFARNSSQPSLGLERPGFLRQDSEFGIDLSNATSMWEIMQKTREMKLDITGFFKENIGTFTAVLESIWSVLRSNINLLFNILTATLSLVFGGGTALLNLIISMIVFMTTLFYLLASSGDTYMPVELFTKLSPAGGDNKFGLAVEGAISSVIMASLKMALFYGLYTWMTHTMMGLQIVFIPCALASVFAAVPFLGTYWAALPAVIELWLVNGEPGLAVLLFVCHMLPTYIVDTAIYSDIKGGHPYLTGLAIAGGMYWLGLEGAIMGPVLLCCLVVAVNIYSSMLGPEQPMGTPGRRGSSRVRFRMNRGFSEPDG